MAVAAATRLKLITSTGKIKNRCSCMVWRNNTKWKRVDTRCTRLQCATSNWLSESRNACAILWENGLTRLACMVKGRHCLRMLYEGLLRALVLSDTTVSNYNKAAYKTRPPHCTQNKYEEVEFRVLSLYTYTEPDGLLCIAALTSYLYNSQLVHLFQIVNS